VGNLTSGGDIFFRRATYDFDSITIGDVPLRIVAEYGTVIRPTANDKTIFTVNKNSFSETFVTLEGFKFETNSKTGCTAIEVRDSIGVSLRDITIEGDSGTYPFAVGVLLHSYASTKFCESCILQNVNIKFAKVAIELKKTSGTGSFAQTSMRDIFVTMLPISGVNPIALKVGTGCIWDRPSISNFVAWSDDGVGGSTDNAVCLYVDGIFRQGQVHLSFETFGTPTNNTLTIIGANANMERCNIQYSIQASASVTVVSNPNKVAVGLIYRADYVPAKADMWVVFPNGNTTCTVVFNNPEEDENYAIIAVFYYWNPQGWYISAKSATQFTVTVATAPSSELAWGWMLFRNRDEVGDW